MRRRRPQRPGQRGGFGRGGLPPLASGSSAARSKGFARAFESVFPPPPDVARRPEGMRRRRPQRPGQRGGFGRGGRPPLASGSRAARRKGLARAFESAFPPPPDEPRGPPRMRRRPPHRPGPGGG